MGQFVGKGGRLAERFKIEEEKHVQYDMKRCCCGVTHMWFEKKKNIPA